jgi:spermidine synthase
MTPVVAGQDSQKETGGERRSPCRNRVRGCSPAAREMKTSSLYIYVLAFFSGMCIMAVELCASRLMAPFFGTSTFVWTNIIGIIMIALSAGYVLGGRLADRKPRLDVLLKLLLAACVFLLVLPFMAPPIVRWLASLMKTFNSSFSFIFFGSLFAITLLFSPPIVVMGMTSPFLIRLIARSGHEGDSAGRIFGLSTIGSVAGTFLPILVFIPTFGTARTILVFAAALFVVTTLGFVRRKCALLSVVAVVPFLFPMPSVRESPGKIYSTESAYQFIEVFDKGSYRHLVYNDAVGSQTVANKASALTGLYYDYYSLLPSYLDPPPKKALIIGLGGGIIANQMYYFHPEIGLDGVEIDPEVIKIARTYFALTDTVRVFNQDGRIFVSLGEKICDIVIVDAYTQQVYIPFHLTTKEFFAQVKKGLSAEGVLAMNVSSAKEDSPLIKSISNTLRLVFGHVYRLRIPGSFENLLVASDRNIDFASPVGTVATELRGIAQYSRQSFRESLYDDRYPPLTDDRAPIEHMVDWEILRQAIR